MASSLSEPVRASENTQKAGTVLIIDDDAQHLKIYCWMLERKGWTCIPALVGSTSVQLPVSGPVCMVLLDYRLNSSLTAAEVAAQVAAAFPLAPIVILSELPWLPEAARHYAKGFVHKGEPEHLYETVATFCGNASG